VLFPFSCVSADRAALDWSNAPFINGGLDLSMPGVGFGGLLGAMWGDALVECVKNGSVAETRVDDAVRAHSLSPLIIHADPLPPARPRGCSRRGSCPDRRTPPRRL